MSTTMTLSEVLTALMNFLDDMGLMVFVAAGAVIAAAVALFKRIRK